MSSTYSSTGFTRTATLLLTTYFLLSEAAEHPGTAAERPGTAAARHSTGAARPQGLGGTGSVRPLPSLCLASASATFSYLGRGRAVRVRRRAPPTPPTARGSSTWPPSARPRPAAPCRAVACLRGRRRWDRRASFGESSGQLEHPRRWLGARWASPSLGVPAPPRAVSCTLRRHRSRAWAVARQPCDHARTPGSHSYRLHK